jgi:hypothetical protein
MLRQSARAETTALRIHATICVLLDEIREHFACVGPTDMTARRGAASLSGQGTLS